MFKTWVDTAYAVHDDMKSHTGGIMSFGLGVLNVKSCKQHLNVKSSTEAEVVGASDYLQWLIWVKNLCITKDLIHILIRFIRTIKAL
jgi:hypothetical protein